METYSDIVESTLLPTVGSFENLIENDGFEHAFQVLHKVMDQKLMSASLQALMIDDMPTQSGIYALFLNGILVYVGAAYDIRHRTREHIRKICQAPGLDISNCQYRYTLCSKGAALSCEHYLIQHYNPIWNRSGFGSKNSAVFTQSPWNEKYGRSVPILDDSLRLRNSRKVYAQ